MLPAVYSSYVDLPDSLRKQHRIGLGQILLKIGDDGPYRHLKENEIIADLAQGLAGAAKFKLVPDAFFIDRQNFRLDVLAKLFTNLGIDDSVRKLKAHPGLKKFMDEHGEDFDLSNYLAEFVSERNDVGHSQVENTVSVDQVSEVGEFIIIFCEAIAWLLETEISTI